MNKVALFRLASPVRFGSLHVAGVVPFPITSLNCGRSVVSDFLLAQRKHD